MFTGLVEKTGQIVSVDPKGETTKLVVSRPPEFDDLERGHSVAVNGVCLTLVNIPESEMEFELGHETLQVSTFSKFKTDSPLNLERPLRLGDRLHGHLVTGHVDGVAKLEKKQFVSNGCVNLYFSHHDKKYIWEKGSVTLNGVSLTVNEVRDDVFSVCLVPETLTKTNLVELSEGSLVNIEYDFWAKAIVRQAQQGETQSEYS